MTNSLERFRTLSTTQWSTLSSNLKERTAQKQKRKSLKQKATPKPVRRSAKEIKEASQLPSTKILGAASRSKGGRVGRMGIGSKKIPLRSDDSLPSEEASHSGSTT